MTQDDATYTVTISGPGFSVTAGRSVAEEADMTCSETLAWALGDAVGMSCFNRALRAKIVLAQAVACAVFGTSYSVNGIDECTNAFRKAAANLDDAWRTQAASEANSAESKQKE